MVKRRIFAAACLSAAFLASGVGTGAPAPVAEAGGTIEAPPSIVDVGGVTLHNSFVSSVGWVKPGDEYPSRLLLTNTTGSDIADVSVSVAAATGSEFAGARSAAGSIASTPGTVDWQVGHLPAGATRSATLQHRAATTGELPTIIWRDLSSVASLSVGGDAAAATSHGPKVIPAAGYDTARYGDRPFPVVPVAYTDREYQPNHTGEQLEAVINDPELEGSTFNLFQEMSLGQLFPDGTVPSSGIATAGFDDQRDFTSIDPTTATTCVGATVGDAQGTPLYDERIANGVYQLPGTTGYYGSDGGGSAVIGALAGVGALMQVDSGCGPTGKLVYDSASIADPEINYSDYDTDKDGIVDFFMVVFAGCGGNGSSQLTVAGCAYPDAPYDNVWPHSSSLEYYYTDPDTGLPGYTTDDQLHDLEGRPMFYTDDTYSQTTTTDTGIPAMVRVGPYNVNPETAIDHASVISHEYGHSLGLPDFYSLGSRETYGDWNLMATDKSQNMDVFSRQELGWIVPEPLNPGAATTVSGWTDSKEDTDTIQWRTTDGTPYTLAEGTDGRVQNAQSYVAKLPGRVLLDGSTFALGEGASPTHAWWSGSGNDFGCATDGGGHNIDLFIPELADLPAGTQVDLEFKTLFDIEWDFDYGFVLTSTDGGRNFESRPSTSDTPTTTADNPNQNGCQATYSNGITGSSASHANGTATTDRLLGEYPDPEWITDRFDVSNLAGSEAPVLRLSYATDPGLANPGWYMDDLSVTATTPDGAVVLFESDFETSGGPDDGRIFNGGCRGDMPGGNCTAGWQYLEAGAEAVKDHAYYLELRDRSGFDADSKGQNDRAALEFQAGLSLVYTDEAHGYGNVGTDNPPAQTPLDAVPDPGSDTPDLADAAFTAADARSTFSDFAEMVDGELVGGHTDNYSNPSETRVDSRYPDVANPWRFVNDCLSFEVLSMTGNDVGPTTSDGNLTADVAFEMGDGCATFNYDDGGTTEEPDPQDPVNPNPDPDPDPDPDPNPPDSGDSQVPFLRPIDPARFWDTRDEPTFDGEFANTGRLDAGDSFEIQVAGRGEVPEGSRAVVANLVADRTGDAGYATLYPCGSEAPVASHVNYLGDTTVSNNVVVPLTDDGTVCATTLAAADLVLDVNGYVDPKAPPAMIEPTRYLDTRDEGNTGTFDHESEGGGPIEGGSVVEVPIAGRGDIPAEVKAAIINVTAVDTTGPGFVTVFPCDGERPTASNINYFPGDYMPNGAIAALSETGSVCLYTSATANLLVDVAGFVPKAIDTTAVASPARLFDSRPGEPLVDGTSEATRLTAGQTVKVQVTGRAGVPDDASAAILNVAAVEPTPFGYVTLFPCDEAREATSNLNFTNETVRANNSITALDADGQVCAYSLVDTDLVIDVAGWLLEPPT